MLEKAITIAVTAHAGQIDKAGQPYILHPLRCMLRVETDAQRIAAVLHDVVEDTDWTIELLAKEGFPPSILETITNLTHNDNEPYEKYISRVIKNKDAMAVKIADLEDNMNITRLQGITEKDMVRLDKYIRTWQKLKKLS